MIGSSGPGGPDPLTDEAYRHALTLLSYRPPASQPPQDADDSAGTPGASSP